MLIPLMQTIEETNAHTSVSYFISHRFPTFWIMASDICQVSIASALVEEAVIEYRNTCVHNRDMLKVLINGVCSCG